MVGGKEIEITGVQIEPAPFSLFSEGKIGL